MSEKTMFAGEWKCSDRPACGGWAPGDYVGRCRRCYETVGNAAKGFWECADCAYRDLDANLPNRIVGLAGRQQTGKSTVSDYIGDRYRMSRIHVKEPMMRMAAELLKSLGIKDHQEIQDRLDGKRKNEDIPGWPGLSGRHILRVIGKEAKNGFWADGTIFNQIWLNRQADATLILNESVRFPEEITFLKKNDARLIWVQRDTGLDVNLEYEPCLPVDVLIVNEGSLEELHDMAEIALRVEIREGQTAVIFSPDNIQYVSVEEALALQV